MRLKPILVGLGVVITLVGLLWIGQGTGYIRWPASSFMIGETAWTDRGTIVAVFGLAVILVARRLRR